MTKNLSKQLCELCGIEPKTRYHVRIAGPVYKISKETVLKNSKIFRSPSIKVRKVTKDYPDFSNPGNFVKLLNLPTEIIKKNGQEFSAKSIWWIVNIDSKDYNALAPYYFDDLLIRLIVILENKNKKYSSEFLCKIKQTIKETQWLYD